MERTGSENGPSASHGCVHVPHDAMASLYAWLPVGARVIVARDWPDGPRYAAGTSWRVRGGVRERNGSIASGASGRERKNPWP